MNTSLFSDEFKRRRFISMDTFDPKPGTETGGPTQAIKTNADGVQLAENLPLLANHADKIAVIRGMTSTKGAHQQGNYFMHTSYAQRSTIVHPSMGAWMTRLDGRFNPTLPGAVVVSGGSRHPLSLVKNQNNYKAFHLEDCIKNHELVKFKSDRFDPVMFLKNKS